MEFSEITFYITNMKCIVKLFQGQYIKQMFEHSVSNWDPMEQDGKFLQVSGNYCIEHKPFLIHQTLTCKDFSFNSLHLYAVVELKRK